MQLGVFPDGKKACDRFSAIKSNNALCYAMAAIWAKDNKLNDAIILNQFDRIADTTIANLFVVTKEDKIITPKLSEGCVAGILRRYLIEKSLGMIKETEVNRKDLISAKEIFLTNCIKGIMWVDNFEGRKLDNSITHKLFEKLQLNNVF